MSCGVKDTMKEHKSIVTEYTDISAFSGAPAECTHHLIFGRGLRKLADRDGIFIPLTNSEHNMSPNGKLYQIHENPVAEKLSKMVGQLAWEKEWILDRYNDKEKVKHEAREEFRKRYGISYL